MNPTVASNILRQMNSKIGGDLFTINFSKDLYENTMLLGIDVCHAGPQSIVGFCATVNKEMSQYYSDRIFQERRKEIVSDKLKESVKKALASYEDNNK